MQQKIIRLCYRKLIDAATPGAWEKLVFEESYAEFLMQAQLYNGEKKYTSFAQLLHHVPGADQLHFLVSASVTGYLKQLNGIIPDITNTLGKQFISFSNYRFEMVNSDIKDKGRHQVAINFYSDPLHWYHMIGNYLLLSISGEKEGEEILTELLALPPFVSIYSIKEA